MERCTASISYHTCLSNDVLQIPDALLTVVELKPSTRRAHSRAPCGWTKSNVGQTNVCTSSIGAYVAKRRAFLKHGYFRLYVKACGFTDDLLIGQLRTKSATGSRVLVFCS